MIDKPLGIAEHLSELRKGIIKSIVVIGICFFTLYNYIDAIFYVLIKPVGKLVFISPQEAFVANIKIAFFGSLILSLPFLLYQIWKFISVGLNPVERKYVLFFGPLSFIFFVIGAAFGYFVMIPIGIKFLFSYANDFLVPMITVNNYISFVGALVFAFGLIFELPLILTFLTKIGLVTPNFLSKRRREAIVLIFIVAAILTPPDVVSQFLMAGPLLILYEVGILFSKLTYKRKELNG